MRNLLIDEKGPEYIERELTEKVDLIGRKICTWIYAVHLSFQRKTFGELLQNFIIRQ